MALLAMGMGVRLRRDMISISALSTVACVAPWIVTWKEKAGHNVSAMRQQQGSVAAEAATGGGVSQQRR